MFGFGLTKLIPYILYLSAFLVMLISFRKPKIGLYFLVPLLPLTNVYVKLYKFPLGSNINDLLFLSITLGWLWNIRDETGKFLTKNPLNKYILLLMLYSLLSYIIGSFYWDSAGLLDFSNQRLISLKNYLMLPLLFLMTVNLIKTKREITIVMTIMIMILFIADFYYFQNMAGKDLSVYRDDIRKGFIFANIGGNEFAAFLTHFIFLPLGLVFYDKRKIFKLFYPLVILFTLYPIVFLFSRGAYVAVMLGLIYIGIKKSRVVLLGTILMITLWTAILPSSVVQRINMTETTIETGRGELDHSSQLRLEYWKLGFEQFLKNPLLGVGFDTSRYFRGGDLHNKYVEILAEEGIIGLCLFLSILFCTFKNGLWLEKHATDDFLKGLGLASGGVVVACAVTNIFGDRWTYLELSAFFFIFMALIMNAKSLVERENMENGMIPPTGYEFEKG